MENVIKPIKYQYCPHIENSQLICKANQWTGFYMRATPALNGLILMFVYRLQKLFFLV